jgi:nifR3 family TIM-barrel protein
LATNTPIALAPMAGVTNAPFRRLCREFAAKAAQNHPLPDGTKPDLGFYVAEMVTSRAVVERNPRALRIVKCDDDESPRSLQVYGVDPGTLGAAVAIIAGEDRADHIDLNFGCPVPKVTRKGGGGALPWKTDLFAAIVRAAVTAAQPFAVPVTVKMRIGIDDAHETYLDAAKIAVNEGVAALTLHARTVAERYSGQAHWDFIAALKQAVSEIPVLGNGDIFAGNDALAMIAQTGCDGVVVGRGALGRPWLFYDLVAALHAPNSAQQSYKPKLSEVAHIIERHAQLLADYFHDEPLACRDIRKHIAWYLRGFPVGGPVRRELALVTSLQELHDKLAQLPDAEYPEAAEGPRGRAGSAKPPHLPYGWLDSRALNDSQQAQLLASEGIADSADGG